MTTKLTKEERALLRFLVKEFRRDAALCKRAAAGEYKRGAWGECLMHVIGERQAKAWAEILTGYLKGDAPWRKS